MFEMMRSMTTDAGRGVASGMAMIPADSPLFSDHFPGGPLVPGSILIELAAQIAGPLAEETVSLRLALQRWAMLGMIRGAKFLRQTRLPADILILAKVRRAEASAVMVEVAASVEGSDVLRAELWMMMLEAEPEWTDAIAARHERIARWKGASQ